MPPSLTASCKSALCDQARLGWHLGVTGRMQSRPCQIMHDAHALSLQSPHELVHTNSQLCPCGCSQCVFNTLRARSGLRGLPRHLEGGVWWSACPPALQAEGRQRARIVHRAALLCVACAGAPLQRWSPHPAQHAPQRVQVSGAGASEVLQRSLTARAGTLLRTCFSCEVALAGFLSIAAWRRVAPRPGAVPAVRARGVAS